MRKIFEVLRLSVEDGRSRREIARAIVASPTTVGEILRRAKLAGLSYLLPVGLSETDVEALLYPWHHQRLGGLSLTWVVCIVSCAGKV